MNNPVQKVFILNLILNYGIFFGYYHNVSHGGYKRFLLKVVSVLIGTAILYFGIKCPLLNGDPTVLGLAFEYMVYVFCALTTGNGYLIDYFNADIFEENLCSNNKIHKFMIQYIVFLHIFYTFLGMLYYFSGYHPCGGSWVNFSVMLYLGFAVELGFMPVISILFLLYLRTSFLCTKIREEASQVTTALNWKKSVNLYIKNIETLEKTDWPIKFMMVVHLIVSFINVSNRHFHIVLLYKNSALSFVSSYNICVMTVYTIFDYAKAFCPAIIMELILKELDTLKIEMADKMITCTDERRKEQLHKMLKRFHSRPLAYTIWRALRVDSSLPLRFLSLAATCLVCLLQFTHVLET